MHRYLLIILYICLANCTLGNRTVITSGAFSKDYDSRLGNLVIKTQDIKYEKHSSIKLTTSCDYNSGIITVRLTAPPEPEISVPNKLIISIYLGRDYELDGPFISFSKNVKFYDYQIKEPYCGVPPGSLHSKYKYTGVTIKTFKIKVDGRVQEIPDLSTAFELAKASFNSAYKNANEFKLDTYTFDTLKEFNVYGKCSDVADGFSFLTVGFELPAKILVEILDQSELKLADGSIEYSSNLEVIEKKTYLSDLKSYQTKFRVKDCKTANEADISISEFKLNGIYQSIKPFKFNYEKDTFIDLIPFGQ